MVFIMGSPSSDFGFKMALRLPCGHHAAGGLACKPLEKPLQETVVTWIRGLTVDVVSHGHI